MTISIEKASLFAEASNEPLTMMLRAASYCLERDPPDIAGAQIWLHAARLADAVLALGHQKEPS